MRTLAPIWMTRNFDSLFDDLMSAAPTNNSRHQSAPATEVSEDKEHFLLSIDLPGYKKEDIKIEILENVLTISGERKDRFAGSFKRSFSLGSIVNAEKLEAHYEAGVLDLYLPKIQKAQSRQIEIQSGRAELKDIPQQNA